MSLPPRAFYSLNETSARWGCAAADLAGWAATDHLTLVTSIDGEIIDRRAFTDLIRSPSQLLAEVSGWMTLSTGDVLLVGIRYRAPQARVGQSVQIRAEGLGSVHFTLAEGASA